jgi:hypothetical protein
MAKRFNPNCGLSWSQWHKEELAEEARLAELEANPTEAMKLHKEWVATLLPLTQDLKDRYLTSTEKWSTEQVQRNIERRDAYRILANSFKKLTDAFAKTLPDQERIDYFRKYNSYLGEQKFTYNSPAWYFTPEFITRSIKDANEHYTGSIEKLAYRLSNKGMLINRVEVKNGRIGINLDMTFTDGDTVVKAWTIIAEGPVQRPHYRYLIK